MSKAILGPASVPVMPALHPLGPVFSTIWKLNTLPAPPISEAHPSISLPLLGLPVSAFVVNMSRTFRSLWMRYIR